MSGRRVCVSDFEEEARKVLPKAVYDYYRSGADEQYTLADNVAAFNRWHLVPRVLRDVSTVDLSVSVLGHRLSMPLCVAATAMQRMAHPEGETATARAPNGILLLMDDQVFLLDKMNFGYLQKIVRMDQAAKSFFLRWIEAAPPRKPLSALGLQALSFSASSSERITDLPEAAPPHKPLSALGLQALSFSASSSESITGLLEVVLSCIAHGRQGPCIPAMVCKHPWIHPAALLLFQKGEALPKLHAPRAVEGRLSHPYLPNPRDAFEGQVG
ncbi:putative hydroxyacid oxidase 1 [Scophthalmus maximus]|uniref:Putative hydroxyacid oxidase 1 n=1 Tax=Scophthalmus maximus TaxID=52904 RepID=A0A2U9CNZ8_SCOMX|nr:putative hydroxyacid oxidase 1 [Scophthalmus maximus]